MSSESSIAFLAEASRNIGTGHVVETLAIARQASAIGMSPVVWVNAETPAQLIAQAPCPVHRVPDFEAAGIRAVAEEVRALGIEGVVTNLRSIQNEQVAILKECGLRVLCIDEWGRRHLDCDVVLNASPVKAYHQYTSNNPAFRMCAGVEFLPLAPEYEAMHAADRCHRGPVQTAVVSMGGMDRTGATVRLVTALLDVRTDVALHLVIGAGFAHRRELAAMREATQTNHMTIHENLPSLANLLCQCDVGFTAGGNTLAELACVGTPALVAFEDPHEREQGEAFERLGFGRCLGAGISVEPAQIRDAIGALDDPAVRERHCITGKALVDGKGVQRVLNIAATMLNSDSAVSP